MSVHEKGCIHCGHKQIDLESICPECGVRYSEKKTCAHCGYTAEGIFLNDQCPDCGMSYWECGNCKRIVMAKLPPEECPACEEKCDFKNVTCYTPDCGGPVNLDQRLV